MAGTSSGGYFKSAIRDASARHEVTNVRANPGGEDLVFIDSE
jgi:hypothetical protein